VSAQRFQLESVAYQSIEACEAFAHVSGSQGQINPGGRPDAKHDYTLSKTLSSRSKVPESKSARTSILRPWITLPPKRILLACLRAVWFGPTRPEPIAYLPLTQPCPSVAFSSADAGRSASNGCSDARYSRKVSQDNYDGNVWLKW